MDEETGRGDKLTLIHLPFGTKLAFLLSKKIKYYHNNDMVSVDLDCF